MMTKVRSVHNCSGHANPLTLPPGLSPSLQSNTLNRIRVESESEKDMTVVKLETRKIEYQKFICSTNYLTLIILLH